MYLKAIFAPRSKAFVIVDLMKSGQFFVLR